MAGRPVPWFIQVFSTRQPAKPNETSEPATLGPLPKVFHPLHSAHQCVRESPAFLPSAYVAPLWPLPECPVAHLRGVQSWSRWQCTLMSPAASRRARPAPVRSEPEAPELYSADIDDDASGLALVHMGLNMPQDGCQAAYPDTVACVWDDNTFCPSRHVPRLNK